MWTEFYEQYVTSSGSENASGFISCKCPFHHDKNASAGFNVNSGVFHCFACEDRTWTPTAFLVELTGMSWPEASYRVDEYRREHDLVEKDDSPRSKVILARPAWETLVERAKANMSEHSQLVIEYMNARGISYDALVRSGVGLLPASETEWKRDSLVFPYTYNNKVCGVRLRDALGNKRSLSGSHMTLWGVDSITDNTRTVVVVEGESDRLRLLTELSGDAIAVVSCPGNQFKREWVREFQGIERAIVIPQADEASRNLVTTTTSALKSKVVVVSLPWKRRQTGKDICDWMYHNNAEELLKLLHNAGGLYRTQSMDGFQLEEQAKLTSEQSQLVHSLIKRQQLALIVGPEKALKTWFAFNLARTVLSPDKPFLDIPTYVGPSKPGKVLIIEEEGTVSNLYDRACMVFHDVDGWRERVTWWHRRGVRLDEDSWIEELEIACDGVDMLILDPMQDLHSAGNENDSTEMAPFWHNIRRLMMRFPDMVIVLIHHFNKTGVIEQKWKAIRGSSRTGGTADVGFFLERKIVKDEPTRIVRFCLDGREIENNLSPDGREVFEVVFDNHGLFKYERTPKVEMANKPAMFVAEMKKRKRWSILEASSTLDCSLRSIKKWVDESDTITIDKQGVITYDA